ncbi:hypothetical protein F4860DRAFT_497902 [Xylaria cubensis]|nr:hypothetical protein F4860DRAFT_497902 [Xylaria cubensis]
MQDDASRLMLAISWCVGLSAYQGSTLLLARDAFGHQIRLRPQNFDIVTSTGSKSYGGSARRYINLFFYPN